jgi:GNAT superfamily N-acetyltransferase
MAPVPGPGTGRADDRTLHGCSLSFRGTCCHAADRAFRIHARPRPLMPMSVQGGSFQAVSCEGPSRRREMCLSDPAPVVETAGVIRPARADDLGHLHDIERAAGEPFRELGMAAVADDDPPTVRELAVFQQDGRAWVVAGDTGQPVGYVLVDVVDGCVHVEQVSVQPRYARQGLGKRLLDTVELWARRLGFPAMTLTTFTDVPWNAPYYERLGWRRLGQSDLTPGLAAIREHEAARGLDRWSRVAMRYELS